MKESHLRIDSESALLNSAWNAEDSSSSSFHSVVATFRSEDLKQAVLAPQVFATRAKIYNSLSTRAVQMVTYSELGKMPNAKLV